MPTSSYSNREISWLSFNERVLLEASKPSVPLLERLRFIAIYSSNIDEFYRIRMPVLHALHKLRTSKKKIGKSVSKQDDVYAKANKTIRRQSQFFGKVLTREIIPQFLNFGIHIIYNKAIPAKIKKEVNNYFFDHLAGFLEIIFIHEESGFFPVNNKLYIAVTLEAADGKALIALVNIPSDALPRFFVVDKQGTHFVVFIDDIIKSHLAFIFPGQKITGAYSIKITRDAELDLADEFEGNIADKIEKQLAKRDFGLATRFLFPPGMPEEIIHAVAERFSLQSASHVKGGNYHNLSNFSGFPVLNPALVYPAFHGIHYHLNNRSNTLFREILEQDLLIHTPYHDYNAILRFFNEAAITGEVKEIYVTLYRIANDSRIAHALISAAKNGKKVTVFVEVKARFDELNNIRWAKKMKAAGIDIIYSIPELKVHAKVALVKLQTGGQVVALGLLSSGNLNEVTAGFYTDHILLTANQAMLRELDAVFQFLKEHKKPAADHPIIFDHLLVAQFNLQQHFLRLIDHEIDNCRKGLASGITLKLNNLEEEVLINKLYEAGRAGVKIELIVRTICRLKPGVPGLSENISVRRIVGRFLEHGRIYRFCNNNEDLIYLGSSDWMNRNMYRRIEVCFPIYEEPLKNEIKDILGMLMADNMAAVALDKAMHNVALPLTGREVDSQRDIYAYLQQKRAHPNLFGSLVPIQ